VDRLSYGKRGLFKASKHEVGHGRYITRTLRGIPAPDWDVASWPGSTTEISVRSQGKPTSTAPPPAYLAVGQRAGGTRRCLGDRS